ncbi:hypothetical protein [Butyrivibrio sp. M55]|uniref:hypothetical protein n=1 Tax=Butyrivibrio sp. M55 TaxID=1855323 RepID=UPI0008EECC7B|nr:hypothetical protein [Butyrivibrio sp. M55]SFU81731.1 hypothetical protein SAMN05216540_11180 [Butyrivibrio sp. M55]
MNFFIQVSNPKYLNRTNDECIESLSDAVEDSFPLNTEDAFLVWNHIYVPLSYKYDISYMIEDLVKILKKIMESEKGSLNICWLPDTFRCDWKIEWSAGEINILSHWDCTVGDLEDLLNNNNSIKMPIEQFLNEWKKLLELIVCVLKHNGYTETNLDGLDELITVYEKINDAGMLYKDNEA